MPNQAKTAADYTAAAEAMVQMLREAHIELTTLSAAPCALPAPL